MKEQSLQKRDCKPQASAKDGISLQEVCHDYAYKEETHDAYWQPRKHGYHRHSQRH